MTGGRNRSGTSRFTLDLATLRETVNIPAKRRGKTCNIEEWRMQQIRDGANLARDLIQPVATLSLNGSDPSGVELMSLRPHGFQYSCRARPSNLSYAIVKFASEIVCARHLERSADRDARFHLLLLRCQVGDQYSSRRFVSRELTKGESWRRLDLHRRVSDAFRLRSTLHGNLIQQPLI